VATSPVGALSGKPKRILFSTSEYALRADYGGAAVGGCPEQLLGDFASSDVQ